MFASGAHRCAYFVATAILGLAASGCMASMGSTSTLERDLDSLRLSVDRLRQQQVETRVRLDEVASQPAPAADLETELLLLRDQMDAIEAQLRALAQRLEGSDERLGGVAYDLERLRSRTDELQRRVEAPAGDGSEAGALPPLPVPGAPPSSPPSATALPAAVALAEDPAGIFQKAYADYTRGDYDLAALGFASVLSHRPDGILADDAVYYLAEIAAAQGRREEAVKGFARVEEEYPGGDKVPAAILKRGLLLIESNRIGEGVVQLDHLVRSHPESDEARLARNKLRALGVGP